MTHARGRAPRQGGTWRGFAIIAAIVAVLVLGVGAAWLAYEPASSDPQPITPATQAPAVLGPAEPSDVDVPSLKVHSSLLPLGLNPDHTMAVPPLSQPMQASWYTGAAQPGTRGPAVILGHVNGDGHPGVFEHLADLKPGAEVDVTRADRTVAVFTVDRVDTVPKTAFPTHQVFDPTPDAELRLITCGGDLNRDKHSYESNVVAYAHLTGSHQA